MPTFLTRLRSLRRSKTTSTPAVKSIETDIAPHEERDTKASPDASPDSPNNNTELDSKIYPDLSALFASVEDALRTAERVTEVKKREQLCDENETDSENDYGEVREERGTARLPTNQDSIYASYGSGFGTGWSTFGQEDSPCPTAPRRTHIANNQDRAISANFRPSSADAVLSWSPKQIFESSESLGPSNFSYSSPALYLSQEVQQRSAQQSPFYSVSHGTFGSPSPLQFPLADSPSFPAPAFQSTPKSTPKTPSLRSRAARRRSPRISGRRRIPVSSPPPPLPDKASTMKRTESDRTKSTRRYASASAIGAFGERRMPIRTSTSSSVSRAVNRRKSAEWNTHAASVGVVADPKQTTEFGWPAEVSRELIRLSLGEDAMLHAQETPFSVPTTSLQPEKADAGNTKSRDGPSGNLKRGGPRVSHGHKVSGTLIRSNNAERRPSSAHLYNTTLPPSSSTSSAPGRSDRQQTTATQSATTPHVPSVAAQEATKSRSQSSGDHALDAKSDPKMGADHAVEHKRSGSENRIDWDSPELQEFISREESGGDLTGDALRPSTPMKKSESESTYQTAGSSSYLHAPSLSVIAPTPRGSPGGSRHSSGVTPDAANGLLVPTPPPQTAKSKGKRKAEDSEDGSPPDVRKPQDKKLDLVTEEDGPRHSLSASHAPSSFQSFQSTKSRKRVRLSSPMATPDQSRPGSTPPRHLGSVSSRGSSRSNIPSHLQYSDSKMVPPRPASRAMSAAASGKSSLAFPHRRSLSQSSIPISAIVTPRPASVDRLSSFHMRDPRKPPPKREVGWTLRLSSSDDRGSLFVSWAFWFGFLCPLLWWLASFWRLPQTRMVGTDTEKAVIVDDPFFEREARIWRLRCRIASGVFFLTYVPVIVLLAVFVPRS